MFRVLCKSSTHVKDIEPRINNTQINRTLHPNYSRNLIPLHAIVSADQLVELWTQKKKRTEQPTNNPIINSIVKCEQTYSTIFKYFIYIYIRIITNVSYFT